MAAPTTTGGSQMKQITVVLALMLALSAYVSYPSAEERAAVIEPSHGAAVVGMTQHRPRREQLVQRQRAVKDVAAEQAELPLEIERGQHLPTDDTSCKTRREPIDGCDHEIGDFLAMIVPGFSARQFRRDVLAEQARNMLALG